MRDCLTEKNCSNFFNGNNVRQKTMEQYQAISMEHKNKLMLN